MESIEINFKGLSMSQLLFVQVVIQPRIEQLLDEYAEELEDLRDDRIFT